MAASTLGFLNQPWFKLPVCSMFKTSVAKTGSGGGFGELSSAQLVELAVQCGQGSGTRVGSAGPTHAHKMINKWHGHWSSRDQALQHLQASVSNEFNSGVDAPVFGSILEDKWLSTSGDTKAILVKSILSKPVQNAAQCGESLERCMFFLQVLTTTQGGPSSIPRPLCLRLKKSQLYWDHYQLILPITDLSGKVKLIKNGGGYIVVIRSVEGKITGIGTMHR